MSRANRPARKSTPLFGLAVLGAAILVAGGVLYFGVSPGPEPGRGAGEKANPPMTLEARYAGPLEGTMIQRWRDPRYGVVCYIYLPLVVRHEHGGPAQYGPRSIGTIRCVPPRG